MFWPHFKPKQLAILELSLALRWSILRVISIGGSNPSVSAIFLIASITYGKCAPFVLFSLRGSPTFSNREPRLRHCTAQRGLVPARLDQANPFKIGQLSVVDVILHEVDKQLRIPTGWLDIHMKFSVS